MLNSEIPSPNSVPAKTLFVFKYIFHIRIHHPSAKYQGFAVLPASRFDAISRSWPEMEIQDHVVRKHAASPRIWR